VWTGVTHPLVNNIYFIWRVTVPWHLICFVCITPQISHVMHEVRVLHCGLGTRKVAVCFPAGIDILRFNTSPRPASWLYGYNFSGIKRPGHDLHPVPSLKNYPLHLTKMAKTTSERPCWWRIVVWFIYYFWFRVDIYSLPACARKKQQLS
jgi:hypothetical protein